MIEVRPEMIERAKNHQNAEKDAQRDVIRARVQKDESSLLEVIHAEHTPSLMDDINRILRVAVYCRVSTDNLEQVTSYELQKAYYTDFVKQHPNWRLVGLYADEGASGTNMLHRTSFQHLIADCEAGRIDLVITKSVSRFARNLIDCLSTVRSLKALDPPVGVFFENENIRTLETSSEMILTVLSMVAQEESHIKSEAMNSSVEARFKRGMFLTPCLLGYDHTGPGELVVNLRESLTVKLMYYLLLNGSTTKQIANTLMDLHRPTKIGRYKWTSSSVASILRNERYCGDVLARKTYTPDYLTHKSKRNNKNRNQYRKRDHHEAIVTRDQWNAAQKILSSMRYCHTGGFIPMTVIEDGALRGYVSINRAWAGYELEEYFNASRAAMGIVEADNEQSADEAPDNVEVIEPVPDGFVQPDNADKHQGFQVVSGELFSHIREPVMNISKGFISFNAPCMQRLKSPMWVELLMNPVERMLAVRPCSENHPNAIRWMSAGNHPASIGATKFCNMLFDMIGLDTEYLYKLPAMLRTKGHERILFFDLDNYRGRLIGGEKALEAAREKARVERAKAEANGLGETLEPYEDKPIEVCSGIYDKQAQDSLVFGARLAEHQSGSRLDHIDVQGEWDIHNTGRQLDHDHRVTQDDMDRLNDDILEVMIAEEDEAKAPSEPQTEQDAHEAAKGDTEPMNDQEAP